MTAYFIGYKGPTLLKATVGDDDVNAAIAKLYGEKRNWQGKQWTMEDALDVQHVGKSLLIEWKRPDGRIDYSHIYIPDLGSALNNAIHMPYCVCGSPVLPAGETCAKINPACMCNHKGGCSLPCGRVHISAAS